MLQPGLAVSPGNVGLLLRSLLGQPFYDGSTLPNNPRLVFPELETLLTTGIVVTATPELPPEESGDSEPEETADAEG